MANKNNVRFSVTVSTILNEKIEDLKVEKGWTKSTIISLALERYFDNLRKRKS